MWIDTTIYTIILILAVFEQIKLFINLKKARFFHHLVNKKRILKYFLLADFYLLQFIIYLVLYLGFNKYDTKNLDLLVYAFNLWFILNPINLLLKWTVIDFEDF